MPQSILLVAAAFLFTGQVFHSLGHPAQPAPAAQAEARLVCSLKQGPRAGHEVALPSSNTLKLGEACNDGAGSTGLVAIATISSHAGLSDIFDKIRNENHTAIEEQRPAPKPSPQPPPHELPAPLPGSTVHADREETPVPSPAGDTQSQSNHDIAPAPPPAPPTVGAAAAAADEAPQKPAPPATAAAASAAAPAQAAGAAPSAPPDEPQQVHLWFQGLEKGSAVYKVPASMVLGRTYSATAVIHPPTSPTPAEPDAHALKISPYMRIVLSQTANPGTFDIKPDGNDCKFVSMDADTTWVFNVKPILPGKDRTLDFAAYVVYGTGDTTCRPENLKTIDVLSDTERVTVAAITRQQAWQQITVSFLSDPASWFKFILPGGVGFATISGLIAWWRRRKPTPAPAPAPSPARRNPRLQPRR